MTMNRHFGSRRNKAAVRHPKTGWNFLGLLRPSSARRLPVKVAISASPTLALPFRSKPQQQCDAEGQVCLKSAGTSSITVSNASEHQLDCQLFPGTINSSISVIPSALDANLISKWTLILSKYLRAATGHGSRVSGGGNTNDLPGDSSSFPTWSNTNNGIGKGNSGGGKKRSGDESPGKEHTKKTKHGTPTAKRHLACPFFKYDAIQHWKCATYQARHIADVRQHLRRSHPQQPLHCPICKITFTDITNPDLQRQRDAHVRARSCRQNNTVISGIIPDQAERIHATQPRYLSIEENWFKIWDILFPNANRPDSPYLKAGLGGIMQTLTAIYLERLPRDKLPPDAVPHIDIILNHFVSFVSNMPVTNLGTPPEHDQETTATRPSTRTRSITPAIQAPPIGPVVQSIAAGSAEVIRYTGNRDWHLVPDQFAEHNSQHADQSQAPHPASSQFRDQYPMPETTQSPAPGPPSDVLQQYYAETEQDQSYFFEAFPHGLAEFEGSGSIQDLSVYFPPENPQNQDNFYGCA
ncbi:hypothetical protein B0J13DRAFT_78294 [Dactylonectria estremocensis]|uniref:C2H2-type domain-containing protein n=1 Tax=Dactylonectria estremocensis TaxID=1079267 RepID=A0A9P9EHZ6_9HYPO|nr:hypothetical protein B0J13DRAFT_78294 [Dactylonectria estremocensis]